jgi:hypothetical protein
MINMEGNCILCSGTSLLCFLLSDDPGWITDWVYVIDNGYSAGVNLITSD